MAVASGKMVGGAGAIMSKAPPSQALLWLLIKLMDNPRITIPKSICNPRRTELLRRLSLDCMSTTVSTGVVQGSMCISTKCSNDSDRRLTLTRQAAQHQQLTPFLNDLHTVSTGLVTAEKTSWLLLNHTRLHRARIVTITIHPRAFEQHIDVNFPDFCALISMTLVYHLSTLETPEYFCRGRKSSAKHKKGNRYARCILQFTPITSLPTTLPPPFHHTPTSTPTHSLLHSPTPSSPYASSGTPTPP
jgi:hypothetical protein